ncbi:nitrilase-related carbon-nitrogen hydrolase [Rhizohabitans arisaemae]|uniref:nitrilase-related carbon-nitrogen hydrolase n=1 Tax=Rhizohabitans arisaemae TaxID=2720610 RepID=UPI0024B11F83|nr:nitrilase-related carbon-nitrogen hydrolase [Rhizohabitans arisaemae]
MTAFLLAGVQMRPEIGDVDGNIRRSSEWIVKAAGQGAKLVVLPEAVSAGYVFADSAEALRYAEEIPDGPACSAWAALAAEYGLWIVAGLTERSGGRPYNSAVLIGPDGHVGTFRKAHLWNDEKAIYGPNEAGFPVFDTPLGRIGIAICYDAWFPESFRSAALQGADLIVLPSNWVPVPGQPPGVPAMANLMCMTGAHVNQCYIAGVSRVGVERGQEFVGRSLIVGPGGWPIAGPASNDVEELLLAEVDLIGSRAVRHGNPFNQPLADRRPELYVTRGTPDPG